MNKYIFIFPIKETIPFECYSSADIQEWLKYHPEVTKLWEQGFRMIGPKLPDGGRCVLKLEWDSFIERINLDQK